jgi:hypothetical protein
MFKFEEDNTGFVFFPPMINNGKITTIKSRTLVYLIAFENKPTLLSNVKVVLPGDFISDDIIDRRQLNDIISNDKEKKDFDKYYFPNIDSTKSNRLHSISIVSSICLGWSDHGYEFGDGNPWRASFRDLTEEGRKLYYSIKKLHNNKEVRILTFNNI